MNGYKSTYGKFHPYRDNDPKSQERAKKRAEKDEQERKKNKKPRLVELLNNFIGSI